MPSEMLASEVTDQPEQPHPPSEDLLEELTDQADDAALELVPVTPEAIAPKVTNQPDTSILKPLSSLTVPSEQSLVDSASDDAVEDGVLIP